jgi:hypothetical protein
MTPFTTTEYHRQLHEDRIAALHASMHRPPSFAPRRALGTWLISAGLRLAPEQRAEPPLRARPEASETEAPACAGAF